MEVDGIENWNSNTSNAADAAKFANLKAFVNAAREFEATHSENAINLMTRYLGLIASSCDLSIFSPGRSEVCAFFSSLWRVMSDGRGPHWAGVAVLARASIEPSARHALTHTYKFMPILARLLCNVISNDKKIKLLSVMQDISYGIKISWQESYLSGLMKQLTDWILQPMTEPQHRTIGHKSLTVLVNVCYSNLPAIYALMRTVDTKEFVVHLINLKEGGYGGVEVCRLLLSLSGAARPHDVHGYLACTLRTLHPALGDRDATQLLHAYTFINDLCSDPNLRNHVCTYPNFNGPIQEAIKDAEGVCAAAEGAAEEAEGALASLQYILKFFTVLVGLELYSLRAQHGALAALCLQASRLSLPHALELFAAIIAQYKDEGRLPAGLLGVVAEGLPALLVPPALEPGKCGLQWLVVVCALCESSETQQCVLKEVTPDSFEDTLYSVLQHTAQSGATGLEAGQQAVAVACRTALALAPLQPRWEAALARMLAHHQVRRLLCAGLSSGNAQRRKQVLQLVKHHYFPVDQMNQVFGEGAANISYMSEGVSCLSEGVSLVSGGVAHVSGGVSREEGEAWAMRLAPAQEHAIDALVDKLNDALRNDKICDIATSSVMELYGYKMSCLEQRLHSHTVALQGATEQMASLQHALALLQATNSSQQDVLYTTQMHNEKHKKNIEELHKQLEDAESSLRGFRGKLAAERLDKEHAKEIIKKECKAEIANMETEMRRREKEAEDRLQQADAEYKTLQKKLEQQCHKNSELANVLAKFEERVRQRDRRLEEAAAQDAALRRDLDSRDATIKQLEKTVVEREARLCQVTAQLEEMRRVQDMVAKLMAKTAHPQHTN